MWLHLKQFLFYISFEMYQLENAPSTQIKAKPYWWKTNEERTTCPSEKGTTVVDRPVAWKSTVKYLGVAMLESRCIH